jgi:hypothetical protein
MKPDKRVEKLECSHIPQIQNHESAVHSHMNPDKRAEKSNPFAHTNFKGADTPYLKVENDRFRFAPRKKRSPRVANVERTRGANFSQYNQYIQYIL